VPTQVQQSGESTQQDSGNNSKQKGHFDPLLHSPPGEWSLTSHTVGGNCDIAGTRREEAVWDHPQFDELVVNGKQPEGTFDKKVFSVECDQAGSVDSIECPWSGLDRKEAYEIAVAVMNETSAGSSQ